MAYRESSHHSTEHQNNLFSKCGRAVKNIFPVVASALEAFANLEQKASLGFDPNR